MVGFFVDSKIICTFVLFDLHKRTENISLSGEGVQTQTPEAFSFVRPQRVPLGEKVKDAREGIGRHHRSTH